MKVTGLAVAVSSFLSVASASPAPKLFALKTVASDPRFNDLCVNTYHTGAGTADASLGSCSADSDSRVFYMSGSEILTTVYDQASTPNVHGGVQALPGASYDDWYPVTIDVTESPTKGFSYSAADGFTVDGQYHFLACNWAHGGTAQLFILAQSQSATPLLKNCGFVKLVKG